MGLTFYSEHSVFKYRGLEEEGSNSCILRNINYFINDGLPIIDLPAFKSEPFMRIKSDTIDLNIIKKNLIHASVSTKNFRHSEVQFSLIKF